MALTVGANAMSPVFVTCDVTGIHDSQFRKCSSYESEFDNKYSGHPRFAFLTSLVIHILR